MNKGDNIFYERRLPHYQPLDAMFSIVLRLVGSLPREIIEELRGRSQRSRQTVEFCDDKHFRLFDGALDRRLSGPHWLANDAIARITADAIHYWDNRAFELLAYCIMSNHVHLILATGQASTIPLSDCPFTGQTPYHVTNVLASIKKFSARKANRILRRSGRFWQRESYDHVIRSEDELEATMWYVLNNPVKAGLVQDWRKWQWNYVKEGLIG